MNFDYIKDDSPRHLTAFFSTNLLKTYFTCIWLCGLVMLIAWPKRPLFDYFETSTQPACLSGYLIAAVLILSYINLRCGRGELATIPVREVRKKGIQYLEESRSFLSYALVAFIIHTGFFIFLLLPFFLIAVSISGGTFRSLAYSIVTIFLTALLIRCFGFFAYLTLGRWNSFCYLFTRAVFFAFFLLTAKLYPNFNPLLTIYGLSMSRYTDVPLLTGPYATYFILVMVSLIFLILVNQIIVRFKDAAA